MFRTSYVHHQEDSIVHAFYMVCFSCIYASNVTAWRMCGFSNLSECLHKRMENMPYKSACTV